MYSIYAKPQVICVAFSLGWMVLHRLGNSLFVTAVWDEAMCRMAAAGGSQIIAAAASPGAASVTRPRKRGNAAAAAAV